VSAVLRDATGRHRMLPATKRYAHPSELDLMVQLAGLRLRATAPSTRSTTNRKPSPMRENKPGLNRTQLAEACEVSVSLISEIESGTRNVTCHDSLAGPCVELSSRTTRA
jgi:hypothetical protein